MHLKKLFNLALALMIAIIFTGPVIAEKTENELTKKELTKKEKLIQHHKKLQAKKKKHDRIRMHSKKQSN